MSRDFYRHLGWLEKAPPDFREQLDAIERHPSPSSILRRLASSSLDTDQLRMLARRMDRARAAGTDFSPMVAYKLGIVSNTTTDLIVPALRGTALRYGIVLDVVAAPYGQIMNVAMGQIPEFRDQRLDAVLCALDARAFPSSPEMLSVSTGADLAGEALAFLQTLINGIASYANVPCILQSLAPHPERLFGGLDAVVAETSAAFINKFNGLLLDTLSGTNNMLLDVASIAATVGTSDWHDPKLFNLAKLPFAQDLVPLYADHVCRLIAAQRGKSRRCLVMDLDNTLWSGVIGDDGIGGILLGQGDPTGEAFQSLQRAILALRQRGVVLAVSSKNDDRVAREVFQSHPEMILKENHIAVFQANWEDKASNIRMIADQLALGLDAFVFLDDNPVERDLVRAHLPEVAVPELPDDPALYARALLAGGYFESNYYSDEDRHRAQDYQDQAKRLRIRESSIDMDGYLATLNMRALVRPFNDSGLKRITQLINKSNQFNLTTRRYSETEVERIMLDSCYRTWQVRLEDAFGDNGMISVVICVVDGDIWTIDTWLMSCRVLGRKVEQAVLNVVVKDAAAEGIVKLRGSYIPTTRNAMVAGFFADLGFEEILNSDSDATHWELNVATYTPQQTAILVSRSD